MQKVKIPALCPVFLKELRKEHGLTQEQLAGKLGVTNRTISRWETGINMPDLDILFDLSQLYRIDIRQLLAGEREPAQAPAADTAIVCCAADYGAATQAYMVRRIFTVAVAGVAAVGGLIDTTLVLFQNVPGGSLIPQSLLAVFLVYMIAMQAFSVCRSSVGYLLSLTCGFSAFIISNAGILFLFFREGSYHNYGLSGFLYVAVMILLTFFTAAVLAICLSKRKTCKE